MSRRPLLSLAVCCLLCSAGVVSAQDAAPPKERPAKDQAAGTKDSAAAGTSKGVERKPVQLEATLTVNDERTEDAKTRESAIRLEWLSVEMRWSLRSKGAQPVRIEEAEITYSPYLPPVRVPIKATLPPNLGVKQSMEVDVPEWALGMNMATPVQITLLGKDGEELVRKDFWVFLGLGTPLTGIVGGGAILLTVLAIAFGIGSVVRASNSPGLAEVLEGASPRPKGEMLRYLAGSFAGIATVLWIVFSHVTLPGQPYVEPLYALLAAGSLAAGAMKIGLSMLSKAVAGRS